MTSPALQITFDTTDCHALARFWAATLDYAVDDHHDLVKQMLDAGHATENDVIELDARLPAERPPARAPTAPPGSCSRWSPTRRRRRTGCTSTCTWPMARAQVLNLAGRTSIHESAAVIEQCDLFLGNDSGPMHIAAAMHTPVVAVFGPSNSRAWGPYSPPKGMESVHTVVHATCPASHASTGGTRWG